MPFANPITVTSMSCDVNILIVVDGELNFDSREFGLSKLIAALQQNSPNYVNFIITTKERQLLQPYHFDTDTLLTQHQIWLFGYASFVSGGGAEHSNNGLLLESPEKEVVSAFMETGGIFSTGDHEDLGVKLNGQLPRVKSMRKWFFGNGVPPRNEPTRHDSLRKDPVDGKYKFRNQSDSIPQTIDTQLYRFMYHPIYGEKVYPHPLLSYSDGIITKMPDHMHEGECYIPDELSFAEFPVRDRIRPLPLIIAKSRIPERHETEEPGNPDSPHPFTEIESFGAIGAYDGHQINLGRIVVDSSFHHFTYQNLVGFDETGDTYKQITSYYQNIALWLAPENKQRELFFCALLEAAYTTDLPVKIFSGKYTLINAGTKVRATLEALVSPSLVLQWALNLINEISVSNMLGQILDPWSSLSSGNDNSVLGTYAEILVDAVIGGIALKCLSSSAITMQQVFKEGGEEGTQEFLQYIYEQLEVLEKAQRIFKQAFMHS